MLKQMKTIVGNKIRKHAVKGDNVTTSEGYVIVFTASGSVAFIDPNTGAYVAV